MLSFLTHKKESRQPGWLQDILSL